MEFKKKKKESIVLLHFLLLYSSPECFYPETAVRETMKALRLVAIQVLKQRSDWMSLLNLKKDNCFLVQVHVQLTGMNFLGISERGWEIFLFCIIRIPLSSSIKD